MKQREDVDFSIMEFVEESIPLHKKLANLWATGLLNNLTSLTQFRERCGRVKAIR